MKGFDNMIYKLIENGVTTEYSNRYFRNLLLNESNTVEYVEYFTEDTTDTFFSKANLYIKTYDYTAMFSSVATKINESNMNNLRSLVQFNRNHFRAILHLIFSGHMGDSELETYMSNTGFSKRRVYLLSLLTDKNETFNLFNGFRKSITSRPVHSSTTHELPSKKLLSSKTITSRTDLTDTIYRYCELDDSSVPIISSVSSNPTQSDLNTNIYLMGGVDSYYAIIPKYSMQSISLDYNKLLYSYLHKTLPLIANKRFIFGNDNLDDYNKYELGSDFFLEMAIDTTTINSNDYRSKQLSFSPPSFIISLLSTILDSNNFIDIYSTQEVPYNTIYTKNYNIRSNPIDYLITQFNYRNPDSTINKNFSSNDTLNYITTNNKITKYNNNDERSFNVNFSWGTKEYSLFPPVFVSYPLIDYFNTYGIYKGNTIYTIDFITIFSQDNNYYGNLPISQLLDGDLSFTPDSNQYIIPRSISYSTHVDSLPDGLNSAIGTIAGIGSFNDSGDDVLGLSLEEACNSGLVAFLFVGEEFGGTGWKSARMREIGGDLTGFVGAEKSLDEKSYFFVFKNNIISVTKILTTGLISPLIAAITKIITNSPIANSHNFTTANPANTTDLLSLSRNNLPYLFTTTYSIPTKTIINSNDPSTIYTSTGPNINNNTNIIPDSYGIKLTSISSNVNKYLDIVYERLISNGVESIYSILDYNTSRLDILYDMVRGISNSMYYDDGVGVIDNIGILMTLVLLYKWVGYVFDRSIVDSSDSDYLVIREYDVEVYRFIRWLENLGYSIDGFMDMWTRGDIE